MQRTPAYTTQLGHFTIAYPNQQEFTQLKHEIFTANSYYFDSSSPAPRIIDAGAHIGLATLYFKKLYPAAKITAIEPNPATVAYLEHNLFFNRFDDVEIISGALSTSTAPTETLYADVSRDNYNSTASTLPKAWTGTQDDQSSPITVPVVSLSSLLTEPVAFLKMDIEGAEQSVLEELGSQITAVQEMVVEFHPTKQQSLTTLLEFLERHAFQYKLWKKGALCSVKEAKNALVLIEAVQK